MRGRHDTLDEFLAHLHAPGCVFRVNSGLKLFQSGLELANVGILSVFGRDRATVKRLYGRLGEIRTLLDSGLRFADVAALEFPAFLDPTATLEYETAIFEHNAMLARAVADDNRAFQPISHPSLTDGSGVGAPYCVFRLKRDQSKEYDRLESTIQAHARSRRLLFSRGGSFGFRGHRFEVVRPEKDAPFLRVAMGRLPQVGQARASRSFLVTSPQAVSPSRIMAAKGHGALVWRRRARTGSQGRNQLKSPAAERKMFRILQQFPRAGFNPIQDASGRHSVILSVRISETNHTFLAVVSFAAPGTAMPANRVQGLSTTLEHDRFRLKQRALTYVV